MITKTTKIFSVTDKLHVFQMEAAWNYVPIPDDKLPKVKAGGWGSIPVMATIGQTTWRTSLFPLKGKQYFIPIKKMVCKKEEIFVGDKITVRYQVV